MKEFPQHEPSIRDENDEEVFQAYMEDLKLSPEDFDKKILDVGSGPGKFAKWAKEHHESSEIYSLEPFHKSDEPTKSIQGFAENLPIKSETFDLVVSNGSIPNVFLGENPETLNKKVRNSLFELMRVIKPGGEIRLGRVLKGEVYKSQKRLVSVLDKTLEEIRQTFSAEIEEIPYPAANTYEHVNHKSKKILARAYLIKIHKPKKITPTKTK